MKRLFLAVPLSPEFEKSLKDLRNIYGKIPYLRWLPEKNLHITVLFLGEVEENSLGRLSNNLEKVVQDLPSFVLKFKKIDYAPPGKLARMVWAYFESNDAYIKLVDVCTSLIRQTIPSLKLDDKYKSKNNIENIKPHITLARFRKEVMPPRELKRIGKTGLEGEEMRVEEVWLMESERRRKGAEYSIVNKMYLK